jgi:hypothetical protein
MDRYALDRMGRSVYPGLQFLHCKFWYRNCRRDAPERAFGGRFSIDTRAKVDRNGPAWRR